MKNQYRTNRTMSDAFGPYAVLHIEPEPFFKRFIKYMWSLLK
jgi:hypothetical protein